MRRVKHFWRLIAKALGEKASSCDKEADRVAFIRFVITLQILITNFFIIGGVIKHWNDVPSNIPKTEKERLFNTNSNFL